MKVLCIQHCDFETPGIIEEWAKTKGHLFEIIKPYTGQTFSSAKDHNFIISMGGPQSPRDATHLTYLKDEMCFLKESILAQKHVLGFCLGAQLIGEALGGVTQRSPEKEIGVFPISLTLEAKKDPLFHDFPSTFPVIHWHNDMPGSTEESILLAHSEGCPVQGYRYKPRVYGLQFHMEITKKGIEELISNVPEDLAPSKFTQSKEELLSNDYPFINQKMWILLDRLVEL